MYKAISKSLSFLSGREKTTYFVLTILKALSGLLDIAGIALIGLLSGIAASSVLSSEPLVIFGVTLPRLQGATFLWLVVLVLVVFVLKALIAILLGKRTASYIAKVETKKSLEIAAFLFNGSLGDLQKMSKGQIQVALTGSTFAAFAGLLTSVSTLVSEGFLLVLVALTFTLIDPMATLFVIIYFGVIVLLIQVVIGQSLKRAGTDLTHGSMQTAMAINDVVDSFREISVFHKQDHFLGLFHRGRVRVASSNAMLIFLSGMPRYVVETFLMLGVVIFVGLQFASGQLATGIATIGVFITGGVRIMASLLPLQNAVANIKTQTEQSVWAHELLDEIRSGQNANSDEELESLNESEVEDLLQTGLSVTFEGVCFSYPGSDQETLSDVTINISSGQHVALVGPSGAGKTTIVDLMLGLIQPQKGTISMSGYKPRNLIRALPGLISYVPQSPGIVSGTIAENIALGIPSDEIDRKKLAACIDAAYLRDFIDSLPEGVDASVGQQADALSGGQIQRLGLARALYEEPKLIILDEATSALDAASEAFISSSLDKLGPDVTVIVIAHRLSTVQHSDSVFVIENGTVSASGKFSHLRETVPMIAEYVKLMSFDEN